MFEALIIAVIVECIIVWVLRNQTKIVKRVKLERLLYVAGIATLFTHIALVVVLKPISSSIGLPLATLLLLPFVVGAEGAAYKHLGRIGWRRGLIYSAACNSSSMILTSVWLLSKGLV